MDSTQAPKSAALVTLLNEIEVLLSELHSMESHVRGAQALAAERIAKLQAEHQRELAVLRSALRSRDQSNHETHSEERQPLHLRNRQSVIDPAAGAATGSSEADSRLRQDVTALDQLQRENTTLRCRLAELEVTGHESERRATERLEEMRFRYQRALDELRSTLGFRDRMPEEQRIFAQVTERRLPGNLLDAQRESEQSKAGSATIATERNDEIPDEEHVAMSTDEHDPENLGAARDDDKAASPSAAEQDLRDEIFRLRQEAQERNRILQDRNDELVRVKLQLDQLQERMAQLETSSPEESSADSQVERTRSEFQAQLALLQAELSQKEWALEERQAEACSRELQLRQQITALRKQLISTHRERERDFIFGAGVNDPAEKDLDLNGDEGEAAHGAFGAQRRWNSGFGRKRRWRS